MTVNNIRQKLPDNYTGKILQGDYSAFLKTRVTECVIRFRAFDETGNPAIPYISAWGEDDSFIWYEFAGRRLLRLLGCPASMAADTMRNNVIERRIYKSPVFDKDVKKESIHGAEETKGKLSGKRAKLPEGLRQFTKFALIPKGRFG